MFRPAIPPCGPQTSALLLQALSSAGQVLSRSTRSPNPPPTPPQRLPCMWPHPTWSPGRVGTFLAGVGPPVSQTRCSLALAATAVALRGHAAIRRVDLPGRVGSESSDPSRFGQSWTERQSTAITPAPVVEHFGQRSAPPALAHRHHHHQGQVARWRGAASGRAEPHWGLSGGGRR